MVCAICLQVVGIVDVIIIRSWVMNLDHTAYRVITIFCNHLSRVDLLYELTGFIVFEIAYTRVWADLRYPLAEAVITVLGG